MADGGGDRGLLGMGHGETFWSDENTETFYMPIMWVYELVKTLQTLSEPFTKLHLKLV